MALLEARVSLVNVLMARTCPSVASAGCEWPASLTETLVSAVVRETSDETEAGFLERRELWEAELPPPGWRQRVSPGVCSLRSAVLSHRSEGLWARSCCVEAYNCAHVPWPALPSLRPPGIHDRDPVLIFFFPSRLALSALTACPSLTLSRACSGRGGVPWLSAFPAPLRVLSPPRNEKMKRLVEWVGN